MREFEQAYRKISETQIAIAYEMQAMQTIFSEFPVLPKSYFRKAREVSERIADDHDIAEVIANCKRAIDCQIDSLYKFFGLDLVSKGVDTKNVSEYIKFSEAFIPKIQGDNLRLKLLNAFDIVPTRFIAKVRRIRNDLEHEYKIPSLRTMTDAIELTHLFLNATDFVFFQVCDEFYYTYSRDSLEYRSKINSAIRVRYIRKRKVFLVDVISNSRTIYIERIDHLSPFYIPFMHMSLAVSSGIDSRIAHFWLMSKMGITFDPKLLREDPNPMVGNEYYE